MQADIKTTADEAIEHFAKCLAGYPDRYQYYTGMISGITLLASRLLGENYFGQDWRKIATENGWEGESPQALLG